MLKINWDAALDSKHHRMGVDVIVHDGDGAIVAALYATVPSINDPTVAEAEAVAL
jgi:hypothetical protein